MKTTLAALLTEALVLAALPPPAAAQAQTESPAEDCVTATSR
jgi:hypothetical protein